MHNASVNCIADIPNDCLLISASDDKTIKLWDPQKNRCFLTLADHRDKVDQMKVDVTNGIVASVGFRLIFYCKYLFF